MSTIETILDWYQGTGKVHGLKSLKILIEDKCKDKLICMNAMTRPGGKFYRNHYRSAAGGILAFNPSDKADETDVWLSCPGQMIRRVEDQIEFIAEDLTLRPTRIDCKVRDFERRRTPLELLEDCRQELYSPVRQFDYRGGRVKNHVQEAITIYLGAPSSAKRLRIYDALPQHKVNAIDFELQLRRDRAEKFLERLKEQRQPRAIAETVMGSVRFLESDGKTTADWWEEMRKETGTAHLAAPKNEPTAAKIAGWISHQVAGSLAGMRQGLGEEAYLEFLKQEEAEATKRNPGRVSLVAQKFRVDRLFSNPSKNRTEEGNIGA